MSKIICLIITALCLLLFLNLSSAAINYHSSVNVIILDSIGGGDSWNNAYTMEDVLAACPTVVTKQGNNAYDVSAILYFRNNVYFVSESEFVELKPSPVNSFYTIKSDSSSHIRIGEYDPINSISINGSFWRIYTGQCTGDSTNVLDGEILIYGSNIWCDATTIQDGIDFNGTGVTRIYNSTLKTISTIWNFNTSIQDVKWEGSGGAYTVRYHPSTYSYTGPMSGITMFNSDYGVFIPGVVGVNIDLYDITFKNCTTSVYIDPGCNRIFRLINSPTFENTTAPGSGKPGLKLCYTFNVKVINDTGAPLVGAIVKLKDADGTQVFSEQTITGGVLANDKIVTTYWYRHTDQGGNKSYNNHTLNVTSGLSTTEYVINIDHQISEDIVLLPGAYDNVIVVDITGKIIDINLYLFLLIVLTVTGISSITFFHKSENYFDIISSFFTSILSYICAMMIINGNVCYMTSKFNESNVFISENISISSLSLHYLLLFITICFVLYTIYLSAEVVYDKVLNKGDKNE